MGEAQVNALNLAEMERIAKGIRMRVLAHTLSNNGGYMSQACSAAELLAAMYGGILKLGALDGPINPPPFLCVPIPGRRNCDRKKVKGRERQDMGLYE